MGNADYLGMASIVQVEQDFLHPIAPAAFHALPVAGPDAGEELVSLIL